MKTDSPPAGIAIVGVKHTGKSHVARLVSEHLDLPLLDSDREVERRYMQQTGMMLSVRELYSLDAGGTFRELEAEVCRDAVASGPVVLAAGGGLCDNARAKEQLSGIRMVALEGDADELYRRIMRRGAPAFLKPGSREEMREEFRNLHARRSAEYRRMAGSTVDTRGRSASEVAAAVIRVIEEGMHGGK